MKGCIYGSAPQGHMLLWESMMNKLQPLNGMMVALNCHDNDKIDAMHAKV